MTQPPPDGQPDERPQQQPRYDGPPDEPPQNRGRVRTTSAGSLIGFALTGLVLGWLLRPLSIAVNGSAPTVGWAPVLGLFLAAVILGAVAWSTYRSLNPRPNARRPGRFAPQVGLEPQHAVNRLVLAKASALAGAMVAGGYLGYALSWWGVSEAALAQQRLVQSLVAGAGGVLIVAASLLLERACRVRGGDGTGLP